MSGGVTLQADVSSIPANSLTVLGSIQPLLKALSADNVNPLAVLQAQSLGACFHSNGDWAAKLPDLLARRSSVRLERLSAWVGWQSGDTASFMSQSSGGRTVSLLSLALNSLYGKERCGIVFHGLSTRLLPSDQQNASISQLSDVSACLADKLSCLGFGNLLALHVTRLRQTFFEAAREVPRDLVDMPTEETMQDFLFELQSALQVEHLMLQFQGSKGAGPLVALLMCLCPDDVRIEVEGELIHQGIRTSVVLSIIGGEGHGSQFRIESKVDTHSEDFRIRHIAADESTVPTSLNFKWHGWLSSCLEIALGRCGANKKGDLRVLVANLLVAVVESASGSDIFFNIYSTKNNPASRLPKNGIKPLLGPDYGIRVRNQIKVVLLVEPSDSNFMDLVSSYNHIKAAVASIIPDNTCTCSCCSGMDQWDEDSHPKPHTLAGKAWSICRVAQFWSVLGDIVEQGIWSLFVTTVNNPAVLHVSRSNTSGHMRHVLARAIVRYVWARTNLHVKSSYPNFLSAEYLHHSILSLVDPWSFSHWSGGDATSSICRSSGRATIFPTTLQYPRITNPWTVEYLLVDGRLYSDSNNYSAVVCAGPQNLGSKTSDRPRATKSLLRQNAPIVPSGLGEHNSLILTLRPEYVHGKQVLLLRSIIHFSTRSFQVNFLNIHLGFLSLSPANACEHYLRSPLEAKLTGGVITTSVEAPSTKFKNTCAITLTQMNTESQFLCCTGGISALYQGNCCLTCAVNQAHDEECAMVIDGSL